jgi:hypothetical protein
MNDRLSSGSPQPVTSTKNLSDLSLREMMYEMNSFAQLTSGNELVLLLLKQYLQHRLHALDELRHMNTGLLSSNDLVACISCSIGKGECSSFNIQTLLVLSDM